MGGLCGVSGGFVGLVHRRSECAALRREARRLVLREGFWDGWRGECVAVRDVGVLGVVRGEVLYDVRGFVSSSVELSSEVEREVRRGGEG